MPQVALAHEKSKNNQATRKKLEVEVGGFESKISKYREQMLSVKTNEEYKALQKEIEHAQAAIVKIEDNILALMLEAESSQQEIRAAEARLKEDQQRVIQERRELESEHQKDVSAMESCTIERKDIEVQIPAISCLAMKGFGNSVEESVFRRLVTMSVRSVRFASGRRCFRKFERTIRSSRAMPASAFSTIRKTWITPSRLSRLSEAQSMPASFQLDFLIRITGRARY